MADPKSLKFTTTHEWVRVEGNVATVGITDFAVNQLTDLVYIELPQVGREYKAGDVFGEVESVKAVSDLYAPVAGEIVETNKGLADNLATLSEDPFGEGWMIRLKLADPAAVASLMDRAAYDAFCLSAEH